MPKKKGGKMGNMTEEERLLFLEQQRLAEEEMQKNKEDMLAQFLKVCDSWCLFNKGYPKLFGTKQINM